MIIGQDANGRPIRLTREMRRQTHAHIVGGTRTGKSKLLEWMVRQDIREGQGCCVIDWHGSLYNDLLNYCALLDVGLFNDFRKLILLNPSRPDYITGFNPFANSGEDISTTVSKHIDATIKPWGASSTDETPLLAKNIRVLYHFMVEAKETLPNAAMLLEFRQRELRRYAQSLVTDTWAKAQWQSFEDIKKAQDWDMRVMSTDNRLARFVGSTGIRRHVGLTENNINVLEAMDQGHVILLNLGDSDFLDREAARVFALPVFE